MYILYEIIRSIEYSYSILPRQFCKSDILSYLKRLHKKTFIHVNK